MPRPLAYTLNALVAAFALVVISSAFAQTKPSSMVGLSREQIVTQLGEPKSNIKAGTREVLFFDHLKVTLRNNVVIETEAVGDEPPPPASAQSSAQSAANNNNSPAPSPAPAAPDAAGAKPPAGDATTAGKSGDSLAIKFIKSGGAKSAPRSAPAPAATPPPAPAGPTPPAPSARAAVAQSKPTPSAPVPATNAEPNPPVAGAKSVAAPTRPALVPGPEHPVVVEEVSQIEPAAPGKPAVDPKKKAAIRRRWRLRRDADEEDDSPEIFSTQSYVIAAIVILGGGGFLWWRRNQRNLELAATAVSRAPFESASAGGEAGMFSAEQIGKLGAKKFERLVASYYAKTGVVAERTNAGPESPVHIKIFWKGEPKPFAGVQCHANPPMLIGPKPLLDLFAALSAADIRRGYVVTTGKFNVEARDLAEEKHFTLLSGDIFLEKINALPPAARGELLKETATDETTPPAGSPAN